MVESSPPPSSWPDAPVRRLTRPFERFLHVEATAGVVLILCTAAALVAANTRVSSAYARLWDTRLAVSIGGLGLDYPLWYWINDALMTIFFFVIGLEIKRELVAGELRDRKRVVLPVAAALGGAALPAAIFGLLSMGGPGQAGWAIPMATDIAFVVGCLALLGRGVPPGLKIFLLSLAIVDDLLAVAVIAIFFTGSIHVTALCLAGAGFLLTAVLNRIGVRTIPVYVVVGAGIWLATLKSGIHPTVAGALLGLMTPASAWIGHGTFLEAVERAGRSLRGEVPPGSPAPRPRVLLEEVGLAAREAVSPLERLEVALHPWVGFLIMPLFALANAGVVLSSDALGAPLGLAVAVGLVIGKPVGILGASWLAVRTGRATLPEGVDWRLLAGAGCLAGIGFTMSLFIAGLSFGDALLEEAKMGILLGSLASAVIGMAALKSTLPKRTPPRGEATHGESHA